MPAPDVLPCARPPCARPAAPVGVPQFLDLRAGAAPAAGRRAIQDAPPRAAARICAPRACLGAQGAFRSTLHRRTRDAARVWPAAREAVEGSTGAGR